MDFNSTIDLIIKDLDDARAIIDDLKKYPGVPVLQVELAKSKCKSAGEIIALLKDLSEIMPLIIPPAPVSVTPPVPVNPLAEVNHSVVITPPIPEKKEESKKITKKVSDSSIMADKFSLMSGINEQLGGHKNDEGGTDFMKTKPFANLSEAIGVNDKFLFIREVFDGNKDAYIQAISRLDNAESLSDARAIIMSYTGDKNENDAARRLLYLVKRKLPLNE